jgi:hypothetical protein
MTSDRECVITIILIGGEWIRCNPGQWTRNKDGSNKVIKEYSKQGKGTFLQTWEFPNSSILFVKRSEKISNEYTTGELNHPGSSENGDSAARNW